jgi:hypothetical protein
VVVLPGGSQRCRNGRQITFWFSEFGNANLGQNMSGERKCTFRCRPPRRRGTQ